MTPGDTIGRWTLLKKAEGTGISKWECQCSCGTKKTVRQDHLRGGMSKSCGCLSREVHDGAVKWALTRAPKAPKKQKDFYAIQENEQSGQPGR